MDAMTPPLIGRFLRPVGHYLYCLRVVQAWNESGLWMLECEKFDYDHAAGAPPQPRPGSGHYWLSHLDPLRGGTVWRDRFDFGGNPRWGCCPLYYRILRVDCPSGQKELFA